MTTENIAIIDFDGTTETIREFRQYDLAAGSVKTLANGNPAGRPVETTDPPFDAAIQARNGPVITILADKVTEVFTIRALTQSEIDARRPDLTTEELYQMGLTKTPPLWAPADRPRPPRGPPVT